MADIFISYSRRDKARVVPLVAAIEGAGWSTWWDPVIVPGQEFDRQISAELAAASAVLVVWTPDSVESRWVRGEARYAADRGILVPVRFDGATLPIDVRAFHTIDLDNDTLDPHSPCIEELLQALGALVGRSASPTSARTRSGSELPAATTGPKRISICVLPFANPGGNPEQTYFSDGITEDIITELSRWQLLMVRSRSASFRYRGETVDVKQVARELNVHFIVEGSVRRMGERLRITTQLIDATTGSQVWAEKFDRDFADIFTVQDQVVRTIVGTLMGRMQVSNTERARRKPPANLTAYEYVLEGNALPWDEPEGAAEATRLFEKAIELDPGYGMAYALLAARRSAMWYDDPGDSNAALDEAYALAKRAIELNDNDSTGFSILAQVCLLRRAFDLTLKYARRAIELNPNNQWNIADMGIMQLYLGHAEEALTWFARATEVDPYFDPPWYWRSIGQALMTLHRYEEALAMFGNLPAHRYRVAALRAGCHARLGHVEQTRTCVAACLASKPEFSIRHFLTREPYKDPADATHLAESLRLAGLPA